jgi:hypothetical protein
MSNASVNRFPGAIEESLGYAVTSRCGVEIRVPVTGAPLASPIITLETVFRSL